MAVTGHSFSERFSRWQVLASNLKEVGANPHVAEELAELDGLLARARVLQNQQEHFRAQAREATTQLEAIAGQGDKVRGRMGAILQGKLGFTNDALIRFGFKPRRRLAGSRRRRRRRSRRRPSRAPLRPRASRPDVRTRALIGECDGSRAR
jgi:hypothetical protein